MRIFNAALLATAFSLSGSSFASTPTYVAQCTETAKCSDAELKSRAVAISNSAEADVLFYDSTERATYHYTVVNASGSEFPGMVLAGARKVKELSSSATEAVADAIEITTSPILYTLDNKFGPRSRASGYDSYGLVKFKLDFNVKDLATGLSALRYNVHSMVADQHVVLKDSLTQMLRTFIDAEIKAGGFSFKVKVDERPAKYILTASSNGADWGIVVESKLIAGDQIETNFVAIVLLDDDGKVIFEIPVSNNRVDLGALIDQSFYTVNPGSLRTWFQGINLDVRWNAGCSNCKVTITDIDNPDIGEVTPE